MQMTALQLIQPRQFEPVEELVPVLPPGVPGLILVRTGWLSLCGSDIPFFTGNKRNRRFPFPPGFPVHECTGRVVASSAPGFSTGDWVLAIPEGNQGLAEFFLARSERAVRLTPDLAPYDTACLIQPLSTVMNAVDRLGDVNGKTVAVVGLGSIGLLFCWLLRRKEAVEITGIDPDEARCRRAERMGADHTLAMRSIEAVQLTQQDPHAWDIVIEAVGHQTETINDCLELVQKRGTLLAFGVPDQDVYPFEYETFFRKNATLISAVTPHWEDYLPAARDLFRASRSELSTLFSHNYPIWMTEAAFSAYERRENGMIKLLIDASCWTADCEEQRSLGGTNG